MKSSGHLSKLQWLSVILFSIAGIFVVFLMSADADLGRLFEAPKQKQAAVTTNVCEVDAGKLLVSINDERIRLGAPALRQDTKLATSADLKLKDMVANKYYGHSQVDGTKWSKIVFDQGVNATISEDIGSSDNNPKQSWQEFKDSPDHYASLTNPQFTRIGISAQCTDYIMEKSTGPVDNTSMIGQRITDLTVIHLAGEDAPTPVATPAAPRAPVNVDVPKTTRCTTSSSSYTDPVTTCTTR